MGIEEVSMTMKPNGPKDRGKFLCYTQATIHLYRFDITSFPIIGLQYSKELSYLSARKDNCIIILLIIKISL